MGVSLPTSAPGALGTFLLPWLPATPTSITPFSDPCFRYLSEDQSVSFHDLTSLMDGKQPERRDPVLHPRCQHCA